jgi:hypothetical protein
MRRSILACFIASASGAMGVTFALPAHAQEPLLLRIKPLGEAPQDLGAGSGPTWEDEARQARARNEAVWARAERRANIAIASVCTGCLVPTKPHAEHPAAIATGSTAPALPATPVPIAQTGTP